MVDPFVRNIFLWLFGIIVVLVGVFLFIFTQQYLTIHDYETKLELLQNAYLTNKANFEKYKTQTQNLKQVVIKVNSPDSKTNQVATIINRYAKQVKGDISIYYKNLSTDESVVVDGEKEYYMASLYKVILTIYILDQIKDGKASLSDNVGDPPITLEKALNKIITESNNEYAISLAQKYGWINIEKVMKQKLGIDFSFDQKLQTNVINIGTLFEDIALSLKVDDVEGAYILRLLGDQTKTSKLPKYLPDNIYVHNKTGELDNYSHDAAIIYSPKANYILVFMSKTENSGDTNEKMAKMSQEIYQTLNDIK